MGRRLKLKVRVGSIYLIDGTWYAAGEEFTLADAEAARILRDKAGRRGVEIVAVIDDQPDAKDERPGKLP